MSFAAKCVSRSIFTSQHVGSVSRWVLEEYLYLKTKYTVKPGTSYININTDAFNHPRKIAFHDRSIYSHSLSYIVLYIPNSWLVINLITECLIIYMYLFSLIIFPYPPPLFSHTFYSVSSNSLYFSINWPHRLSFISVPTLQWLNCFCSWTINWSEVSPSSSAICQETWHW